MSGWLTILVCHLCILVFNWYKGDWHQISALSLGFLNLYWYYETVSHINNEVIHMDTKINFYQGISLDYKVIVTLQSWEVVPLSKMNNKKMLVGMAIHSIISFYLLKIFPISTTIITSSFSQRLSNDTPKPEAFTKDQSSYWIISPVHSAPLFYLDITRSSVIVCCWCSSSPDIFWPPLFWLHIPVSLTSHKLLP